MLYKPPSEESFTLPKNLEEKFTDFKRDLLKRTIIECALLAMAVCFLGFVIFLGWDRLIPVEKPGRLLMFLIGFSGLFVLGPLRYHYRVGRYHNRKDLTKLIKKKMPRFGDRLQGVLELRRQDSTTAHFSPTLRQAALEKIAIEAEEIDFRESIPRGRKKQLFLACLLLLTALTVSSLFFPKQTRNACVRYFNPLSETPRYTVVRFDQLPKKLYLARGEATHFTAYLKDPELMESAPVVNAKVTGKRSSEAHYNDGYLIPIPAIEKNSKLTIQAGDAHSSIKLIPTSRPRVEELILTQTLPDYLQLPDREIKMESSYIEVLENSSSSLLLKSNSKLKHVNTTPNLKEIVEGKTVKFPEIKHDKKETVRIKLTDEHGLTSSSATKFTIQPKPDTAPKVSLNAVKRELILLPHETLDIHLSGKDDFGLKELGLMWHPIDTEEEQGVTLASKGAPDSTSLKVDFAFNPAVLKIYPDTYQLYATAVDYFPERAATRSTPITVQLLSLEAHAEHLGQQFSLFLDDLDETYEKELSLYFNNQRLAEKTQSSLRNPDNNSLLKSSISAEKGQIKELAKHHLSSQELLQDAFRNHQLQRSTTKSFALLSEQIKTLLKNDLPELRNTLETSFDNRFSEEHSRGQLQHAVTLQKKALERFKDAIEQARAANKRFESSTFIHRLSELARQQSKYSEQLWEGYSSVIGQTDTELDPALRNTNHNFIDQQSKHRQTLRWIEEDLRNYSIRTEQPTFSTLAKNISESHVYDEMIEIETSLMQNHRNLATVSSIKCAQTINSWVQLLASELNNASNRNGAGGAGNGNQSTEKEQDTEFMLRIMEIIRTQQDLRGRTRAIEQSKRLKEEL